MAEPKNNSFSIIELLQYVRRNNESGCLAFEENGTRTAELYFRQGHLIHARNSKVEGDDVVYQLLGNRTAGIRWDKSAQPEYESVSRTDEVLLLGALGILTEDDAESVMTLASQEAEREMEDAFRNGATQPSIPSVVPEPAPAPPPPEKNPAPVMPTIPPTESSEPPTPVFQGMPQLQAIVGDEVLRPPRFKKWNGLPLPFVSAYSLEPYPESHNVRAVLELLWQEGFSGFMSVVTNKGNLEAVSIIYKGRPIFSHYGEGTQFFKEQQALRRIMEIKIPPTDANALLIYPLEPDFIHSYVALMMGETLLDKFSSQGMKINKLLNTLEHSQHTGVVRVSSDQENGYIFLSSGHKLGSYYEVDDVLEESILRVYQIVGKAGSLIDVLTSPNEARMFETVVRPKTAAEIKQQMIEIAHEVLGKRSSRVVSLIAQSDDDAASLKTYANQARRVTQMFIDKGLADQLYERFLFLINELN